MNRYGKLVNFEINRFLKLYLVLIGIVFVVQLSGVIFESLIYVNRVKEVMQKEMLTVSTILEQYGQMSLERVTGSFWFIGPILLSIATLVIYVFFIWYRDWLGKNTFIYRLLMLPTERINVYLAKATTILLLVLGLVAAQLLFIFIEIQVMQWLVPAEFRLDHTVRQITFSYDLIIFFPTTFTEFLIYYGGGMVAVCLIFTGILFERSYRLKGVFYGILYCIVSLVILFAPLFVDTFLLNNYFYPLELLAIEIVMALLILACAIWTGHYLLKNKIRV